MEYELLLQLVHSPGKKFSRDELMKHLQGFDSNTFSRSIDILISRLRAKLGESARHPVFIKSVHGFGYVFIGEQS
jgi:two-component system OmpR family response regulator